MATVPARRRAAAAAGVHHDLRGASRLAVEAVKGVADLVEAVHLNILRNTPGRPLARATSLVYHAVRGVAGLAGSGLDASLRRLAREDLAAGSWQGREPVLAALNGVLGDYLERSGNPLAIPMTLRLAGGVPLAEPVADASARVLVLAHGLCMNDLQCQTGDGGHGALLARERGYTPVYLCYNTGLHISTNGAGFAAQLEALVAGWPVEIEELVILGHSMGGLVARSACWYGDVEGHRWRQHLRKLVTLGSPHHGSPLERGGNWLTLAAGLSSYSAPFARLAKLRSEGITDLRHGSVMSDDWENKDRFAAGAARRLLPLPADVECYALAGTVAEVPGNLADTLAGDGLVPVRSALGLDDDPAACLHFKASAIVPGTKHIALLSSNEVARYLLAWL